MVAIVTIVGILAILVSTFIMLPECVYIYRTKRADISVAMLILSVSSQIAWFVYGYLMGDYLLAIASIPTFFINVMTYTMFRRYNKGVTVCQNLKTI